MKDFAFLLGYCTGLCALAFAAAFGVRVGWELGGEFAYSLVRWLDGMSRKLGRR